MNPIHLSNASDADEVKSKPSTRITAGKSVIALDSQPITGGRVLLLLGLYQQVTELYFRLLSHSLLCISIQMLCISLWDALVVSGEAFHSG